MHGIYKFKLKNSLENISTFYLPLFNSVAKKIFLGKKKYWRGICPLTPLHPKVTPMYITLLVSSVYICQIDGRISLSRKSSESMHVTYLIEHTSNDCVMFTLYQLS